jgi:hypothetical protein
MFSKIQTYNLLQKPGGHVHLKFRNIHVSLVVQYDVVNASFFGVLCE